MKQEQLNQVHMKRPIPIDKHMTDKQLHSKLGQLILREREVLVEVVTCIYEMNRKKSFARLGFGSMFAYLTQFHKYSAGSAQRRIEAARLLGGTAEIEYLRTGDLTLKNISTVAVAVREKQKSTGEKVEKSEILALIEQVRGLPESKAEQLVAEKLNLTVRTQERAKAQSDGSVRVEFTLTAEENALIEEAKKELSHVHPQLGTKDLLVVLSRSLLKISQKNVAANLDANPTSTVEVIATNAKTEQMPAPAPMPMPMPMAMAMAISKPPKRVTAKIRKEVIKRDRHCQWPNPITGGVCGSQHQLQADHIQSKWRGGGHAIENLQALCSVHNAEKYKLECQAWET